MSAFVVSEKHINSIMNYALSKNLVSSIDKAKKIGQKIWDENAKSVAFRYDEEKENLKYDFKKDSIISGVKIIKAVHCLNYQSCEHDGWEKSKVKSFLLEVINCASHYIQGYDEADWEIT